MEKRYEETTFVICHNGTDIIHPSRVEPGTFLSTGQPIVEEFSEEGEWLDRLKELGFDTRLLTADENSLPNLRDISESLRISPSNSPQTEMP
jgi:hypothetical protein